RLPAGGAVVTQDAGHESVGDAGHHEVATRSAPERLIPQEVDERGEPVIAGGGGGADVGEPGQAGPPGGVGCATRKAPQTTVVRAPGPPARRRMAAGSRAASSKLETDGRRRSVFP